MRYAKLPIRAVSVARASEANTTATRRTPTLFTAGDPLRMEAVSRDVRNAGLFSGSYALPRLIPTIVPERDKLERMPHAGEELTVAIEKPAAGGRMIARLNGQIVLVSGTIPGERVTARI